MTPSPEPVVDRRGRPVSDLRLSVTDRCNFRCTYCMPRDVFGPDHAFLAPSEILSYDEFGRLVSIFAGLGVTKIRLTGGEPLLRPDLETLIQSIVATPGIDDVALTTNGSLLADRADSLRDAGLNRVTISLDSLDPDTFQRLGDTRIRLDTVLAGIAAAKAAGLDPIKLNAVVRRGINDAGVIELAEFARGGGYLLRFIEYMDVGNSNGWTSGEVVAASELVERIADSYPVEAVDRVHRGDVATRWRYLDGAGEIGTVASVTQPFCSDCTRARITSTGELFTCLFAAHGTDLRALLRGGATDADLRQAIAAVWVGRDDRYSELRQSTASNRQDHAEMSYLGG